MYGDSYYPEFLVDKIKVLIEEVIAYLEQGEHSVEEIQGKLDAMTLGINGLEEEFYENDSEIETMARDCIAITVDHVLEWFDVDIDLEEALRKREW